METPAAKRGAGTITDTEFLIAFNNPNSTNEQVVAELNADGWTPISVKLRSAKVRAQLTVERTGALARQEHHELSGSDLEAAAVLWKTTRVALRKDEEIPTSTTSAVAGPRTAIPPAPAQTRGEGDGGDGDSGGGGDGDGDGDGDGGDGGEDGDGDGDGDGGDGGEDAPAAPPATKEASMFVPPAGLYSFEGEMYGDNYLFEGADRAAAYDALYEKLQDLNYSKVQITDKSTGRPVGFGELLSGGRYKFSKQLTAARELTDLHTELFRAMLSSWGT